MLNQSNFIKKSFHFLMFVNMMSYLGIAQTNLTNEKSNKVSLNPAIINEKITDEQIVLFINNTDLAINSNIVYNKSMKIIEVNLDLQNAIQLQDYSRKLFKSRKTKNALLCSNKAREIAISILRNQKLDKHAARFERFENEEAQFSEINKDHSTIDWLKESAK